MHQKCKSLFLKELRGFFNPLSAKSLKWSNTLKQFVGKLPANCLNVFDHFVGLVLKGLKLCYSSHLFYFAVD